MERLPDRPDAMRNESPAANTDAGNTKKQSKKCNKKVKSEHFLSLRDMLNFFYHKKKGCTNRGFYVLSGKRNFDEKTVFLQSVKYGLPLPVYSGYEKR